MPVPTRLFDCLTHQQQQGPLTDTLCAKEAGRWTPYATDRVAALVDQFSAALLRLGVSAGDMTVEGRDKVALLSPNRPEWIISDMALQQIGAVVVPIYPTISEAELAFVLTDAAVGLIIVADETLYRKVTALQPTLPLLHTVITFDVVAGPAPLTTLRWHELLRDVTPADQQQLDSRRARISADDLATILYTSGTTGTPKGVMLSHGNMLSNVFGTFPLFAEIGVKGKRALSFLPLNHAFERTATYCYLYSGVSIYYAESTDKIGENLREVAPTVFTTVPRLLEKVYERILAKGAELTGLRRTLFDWAVALAERYDINRPLPLGYRLQLAVADRLIFSKWRAAVGGQLKAVITGAAACQVSLLRIFGAADIVIMEGYGLTETSPVISGNRYVASGRRFGTVGPLLQDVTVRIADDGEILCQGPNVMMGYYKRPDLTADTIRNGWLHTGDIGTLVEGRFLKITDRKKELFKTSGGKYVAPQPIENRMTESPWIEQMMVVGADRKFVSALIVPAVEPLKRWFAEQGKPFPGAEALAHDDAVRQLIETAINGYNREFNHVEQVKRFALLPGEWTIAGGELTPTLKLKRKVILEKYGAIIAGLYA